MCIRDRAWAAKGVTASRSAAEETTTLALFVEYFMGSFRLPSRISERLLLDTTSGSRGCPRLEIDPSLASTNGKNRCERGDLPRILRRPGPVAAGHHPPSGARFPERIHTDPRRPRHPRLGWAA